MTRVVEGVEGIEAVGEIAHDPYCIGTVCGVIYVYVCMYVCGGWDGVEWGGCNGCVLGVCRVCVRGM